MNGNFVIIKDPHGNEFEYPLENGLEIFGEPTGFMNVKEVVIEKKDGKLIRTGIRDAMISGKETVKRRHGHVKIIKDGNQPYQIMDVGSKAGIWITDEGK